MLTSQKTEQQISNKIVNFCSFGVFCSAKLVINFDIDKSFLLQKEERPILPDGSLS